MKKLNQRHGGPWDRGGADSYYRRNRNPHYYAGDTGSSDMIMEADMTFEQIEEYKAGYEYNEEFGGKKSWD